MAWTKLGTRIITLSPEEAPPVAWTKLDTRIITLSPPEAPPPPEGWVLLDKRTVILSPEEIIPPPTEKWFKLDTRTITLTPGEALPIPPEYELVYTHDYPDAETYVGKAEVCPFTFISIPEQIPGHVWLAEQIATILGQSMIEHGEGSKMLKLQLWSDTSELLYTKYYAEATATASPVPWALVIGAIAIIAVVTSFIVLIEKVKTIDWGKIPAAIPIAAILIGALAIGGIAIAATRKGGA